MTPMIDVLLVLLIIFMAISPEKATGLDALVPRSESTPLQRAAENPVVLEIASNGSYRLNTQPVSAASLPDRLTSVYAGRAERVLFIRAAPDLEFQTVAAAIDLAHTANVERVALMPR